MMSSRVVFYDGVGFVLFEKSRRAGRIGISVEPYGGVRVAVPARESFRSAEKFADSHVKWMRRHLLKVRKSEAEYEELAKNSVGRPEAGRMLGERIEKLAGERGFTHGRVRVGNQKTQWGACSPENNISLNWKLALLPDELIDYVIMHELVHTRIKTHGRRYWGELDKYVGNAKALDKRLRMYQPALTLK